VRKPHYWELVETIADLLVQDCTQNGKRTECLEYNENLAAYINAFYNLKDLSILESKNGEWFIDWAQINEKNEFAKEQLTCSCPKKG